MSEPHWELLYWAGMTHVLCENRTVLVVSSPMQPAIWVPLLVLCPNRCLATPFFRLASGIKGRGEYVRLVFEEAGVPYVDVAYDAERAAPGSGEARQAQEQRTGRGLASKHLTHPACRSCAQHGVRDVLTSPPSLPATCRRAGDSGLGVGWGQPRLPRTRPARGAAGGLRAERYTSGTGG